MDWIDFEQNKPEKDCLCWVINKNFEHAPLYALYYEKFKVFTWYNLSLNEIIPIHATHYSIISDQL